MHPAFPESQQFILPSNYMHNDCLCDSLRSSYGDTEIQAVIGAWSFHRGGSLWILFWSQLWLCGFKDEQLLPIQSSVDENKPSKLFVEHQHYVQDWASFPVTQSFSHCIRKNHNTHIVFLGGQNMKVRSCCPKRADRGIYLSHWTSAFKSFLCLFHTTDGNVGFPHPKLVVLPPGYLFFESRFFFRVLHLLRRDSLLYKHTKSHSFNSDLWDDLICCTVICIFVSIFNWGCWETI